jgi:hypothetical protein
MLDRRLKVNLFAWNQYLYKRYVLFIAGLWYWFKIINFKGYKRNLLQQVSLLQGFSNILLPLFPLS